jgi:hypothetical protein
MGWLWRGRNGRDRQEESHVDAEASRRLNTWQGDAVETVSEEEEAALAAFASFSEEELLEEAQRLDKEAQVRADRVNKLDALATHLERHGSEDYERHFQEACFVRDKDGFYTYPDLDLPGVQKVWDALGAALKSEDEPEDPGPDLLAPIWDMEGLGELQELAGAVPDGWETDSSHTPQDRDAVFPIYDHQTSLDVPRKPDNMDVLANRICEDAGDGKARRSLEEFLDSCRKTEASLSGIHDQTKADKWSYPESITRTPTLPDPVPFREPMASCKVKDVIRKLRGELARTMAGINLVEAAGRTIDEKDLHAMTTAFTALLGYVTPLSSENAVNLEMASMRLDVQVMEVQVSKYRDIAQKCRDIVDSMRHGYHVSRTAHQVALKTADALYDAYLREIRKPYTTPMALTSTDLPKGLCAILEKGGCKTVEDLALLSEEKIRSIHDVGHVRLGVIRDFFRRHNLPALSLSIPTFAGVTLLDWRSVNYRNEAGNYRWRAPKCYGNLVFEAAMNGRSSSVFLTHLTNENQ